MTKPTTYSAGESFAQDNKNFNDDNNHAPEALSGSKKVKNHNHSRQKQAKGS
ncbi:small acid-soluble spore protein P [Paenibacillus aestuarii]|uniref:Small acid-soluble spore protein P n=1 Tax=Paenibacillus aestuarii TaxID=516965 RepID=A0ABW0KEH3_9BACL|nr:small acid-soluble spore protein P [Paenibacillus aestuarii]